MVKGPSGGSCRVTLKACNILIDIPSNPVVVLICLSLWMTRTGAGINCVIVRVNMAVGTNSPFSLVGPGIYREIEPVMVKCGRCPGRCGMARFTGCRELGCRMIGICRLIVIGGVTTIA